MTRDRLINIALTVLFILVLVGCFLAGVYLT